MNFKTNYILAGAIILALSACKKEDANLPFNKLDEEANKQLVENSAVDAAKAMDELKDHNVIDASVNLAQLLDTENPLDAKNGKKSKVTNTINVLAGIATDESSMQQIYAAMESADELADDPESIQDVWDELVGTYTWNSSMEDWDYVANSSSIVFKFPSTTNGMSNNATLTISNYTGVMVTNPLEEDYSGDLPASLNMKFEIDGETVLTYTFAAVYNSDGIPSSIASNLTLEPFMFATDITNNDEEVSASYKFTKDKDIVIAISGGIQGDFSQQNIDENTVLYSDTYTHTEYEYNENTGEYEEVLVTEVDEWEEVAFEEIIHTGNFKFQVYNISIGGIGDIKALVDAMESIYPENYYNSPSFDEETAAEAEAAAFNEHLHLYALDEDKRKKIADVEAYVVKDSWGEGYYDYWVDFRLVFGDGSLVDLETYFEQGFEDFVSEINSMIDDLNSKYEWDVNHMDY